MSLTRLKFQRFTAFEELTIELSPGINVFIGPNGTGKTHLMKAAYAACDITKTKSGFVEKLTRVFLPSDRAPGRLVKRKRGSSQGSIELWRGKQRIKALISNHAKSASSASVTVDGEGKWVKESVESVYIPVKEMLSNAPGFRSLYAQREVHFEEIYSDIIDRAYRPPLRGPIDSRRKRLLEILRSAMDGRVEAKDEEFFLRSKQGRLEFTLVAEGLRKLGLLWLLIQNGTLLEGSVLFWDEPEANLNPSLYASLVEILLELSREGVQIFLATHDYLILKELDLEKEDAHRVAFHSLYRDSESGEIACHTTDSYVGIHPNTIADTFASVYDREVRRSIGRADR